MIDRFNLGSLIFYSTHNFNLLKVYKVKLIFNGRLLCPKRQARQYGGAWYV